MLTGRRKLGLMMHDDLVEKKNSKIDVEWGYKSI